MAKNAATPAAPEKPKKGERTMPLVLVKEVDLAELKKLLENGVEPVLLEILADESDKLKDQDDVTKWMEKKGFEGELNVLSFRKGQGKREGRHGRMVRRRKKPEGFVVE